MKDAAKLMESWRRFSFFNLMRPQRKPQNETKEDFSSQETLGEAAVSATWAGSRGARLRNSRPTPVEMTVVGQSKK